MKSLQCLQFIAVKSSSKHSPSSRACDGRHSSLTELEQLWSNLEATSSQLSSWLEAAELQLRRMELETGLEQQQLRSQARQVLVSTAHYSWLVVAGFRQSSW